MAATYRQVTAAELASSVGLVALDMPAACRAAHVQAEVADVRFRLDGSTTAPTATSDGLGSGMILEAGRDIWLEGIQLTAVRFIEKVTSESPKLNIHYFT